MTALEKLLSIVLIIGGIFGTIATIPTIIGLTRDPSIWNTGILQVTFFISILVILGVINILLVILVIRMLQLLINKLTKPILEIDILKESKTQLGGQLLFNVKFSGFFMNGYFTISIRSPYCEEKFITVRFDDVKKLGQMRGKYENRLIKLKCPIPKEFSHGEYDVVVRIFEVTTWLFSLKTTHKVIEKGLKIRINEF